eukprot:scaffold97911_cov25-Tisochrysis_lutea.AAC.1
MARSQLNRFSPPLVGVCRLGGAIHRVFLDLRRLARSRKAFPSERSYGTRRSLGSVADRSRCFEGRGVVCGVGGIQRERMGKRGRRSGARGTLELISPLVMRCGTLTWCIVNEVGIICGCSTERTAQRSLSAPLLRLVCE